MLSQTQTLKLKFAGDLLAGQKATEDYLLFVKNFSDYMRFYWYSNKIDFNCDLSFFPEQLVLTYKTLEDSAQLLSALQTKQFILDNNKLHPDNQLGSFHRDRSIAYQQKRLESTKLIYQALAEIAPNHSEKSILSQFTEALAVLDKQHYIYAPPTVYNSGVRFETLGIMTNNFVSYAGYDTQKIFKSWIQLFLKDCLKADTDKQYFNTIIKPILTKQYGVVMPKVDTKVDTKVEQQKETQATDKSTASESALKLIDVVEIDSSLSKASSSTDILAESPVTDGEQADRKTDVNTATNSLALVKKQANKFQDSSVGLLKSAYSKITDNWLTRQPLHMKVAFAGALTLTAGLTGLALYQNRYNQVKGVSGLLNMFTKNSQVKPEVVAEPVTEATTQVANKAVKSVGKVATKTAKKVVRRTVCPN